MSRIGLGNMVFGFFVLFACAAAGSFLSIMITNGHLNDQAFLSSWQLTLLRSAHAHTNLFGLIHVALGLTLPYSLLTDRLKLMQSVGLGLGTLAMAFGLFFRSNSLPTPSYGAAEVLMAICLSLSLAALLSHTYGLMLKFLQRS